MDNAATNLGTTPLHWAAMSGNIEVIQLLLQAGADANAGGHSSKVLDWAVDGGNAEIIDLLKQASASNSQ